jgi:hemerythrin-like metal-binding protein
MSRPLFIKWNERYELGVPLLDEQHRGIVSIINSLYYMIKLGAVNNKLCASILATIKNYSNIHFITEEGLLEFSGYPDLEKHKTMHGKLIAEMERMGRAVEHDDFTAIEAEPLLDFLKKWWIEHINKEDHLYMPHLLANNKDLP